MNKKEVLPLRLTIEDPAEGQTTEIQYYPQPLGYPTSYDDIFIDIKGKQGSLKIFRSVDHILGMDPQIPDKAALKLASDYKKLFQRELYLLNAETHRKKALELVQRKKEMNLEKVVKAIS